MQCLSFVVFASIVFSVVVPAIIRRVKRSSNYKATGSLFICFVIGAQYHILREESIRWTNMSTLPSPAEAALLPHDSYVGELCRLNIAFIAVTTTIIGLRLMVRGFVVKHVAADDFLMVAAGLFATAFSAMGIVGIHLRTNAFLVAR